eukprot:UN10290
MSDDDDHQRTHQQKRPLWGFVYNNVYPDVDRKSGLIIPKTLVKTEKRWRKD